MVHVIVVTGIWAKTQGVFRHRAALGGEDQLQRAGGSFSHASLLLLPLPNSLARILRMILFAVLRVGVCRVSFVSFFIANWSFGFNLVDYFVFEVIWFSHMRTAFGGSGGRVSLDWRMEGGRIAEVAALINPSTVWVQRSRTPVYIQTVRWKGSIDFILTNTQTSTSPSVDIHIVIRIQSFELIQENCPFDYGDTLLQSFLLHLPVSCFFVHLRKSSEVLLSLDPQLLQMFCQM